MNPERWQQIKAGLHRALELRGPARQAYIAQISANDAELRQELESLIEAHEGSAESFLNIPAAVLDAGAGSASFQADSRIGNYRLVCEIGQGGMGQVWLAEQMAPVRRLVALKLIRAGMYDEAVAHRFQAERQSLAIMDHPAIAKVFDAGSTLQGQPYFVMEYVPGPPITEYCDQKRLKVRERLELFIQACEGVQHAHQKAIIHRDLKPANILIVEIDGKAVPRIIDFGLAKAATPQPADQTLCTQYGQFIGTPGFMSPEQIDPEVKDIDTRTDVYSLGVILYVLLAGRQPFETKGLRPPLDRWLRRLREEEPPSLSAKLGEDREAADAIAAARSTERKQLVTMLRGDLEWITSKALERERDRRYGTPSELAADLRRHLNHEPITARPASAAYQIRKFARRHRVAALVIGMMGVLAVAASSAGLIAVRQKYEAEYQSGQAQQAQSRLLIQAAAQRLKDADFAGAQGIILEVLVNRESSRVHDATAMNVFQEIRAADPRVAVLAGHRDWVWRAAYSPDGSRIVSASRDGTGRIWDAVTGTPLAVLNAKRVKFRSAAYSPDGTKIVTAMYDKTARIWDARSGNPLAVLAGHELGVQSAAYSPDGRWIVTGSLDKTARIWDAVTGASIRVLSGHQGAVFTAAYSPEGKYIVTASDDKSARIWNARTGALVAVLSAHSGSVYCAAFSPDGTRVVTASQDKTARIWDASTGAAIGVLTGHLDEVYSAAYSPDGGRIVTSSADKTARIWDARAGSLLGVLSGHSINVESAVFSPDGTRVLTASMDKSVRIWDASMGAQLFVLAGHSDGVEAAVYSHDGKRIATTSRDGTARIWAAATGTVLEVLSGHAAEVEAVAFSADDRQLITGSHDHTARIWDALTGAPLAVLSDLSAIDAIGYSPDGTRIVAGSQGKVVRILDAVSGKELMQLSGHDANITTAAFSPDGRRIVTASLDKTARVWDARTGIPLLVLAGHGGSVGSAAYSPDGTRILTASVDMTARIWDAVTGISLAEFGIDSGGMYAAAFSPDGARIVTASSDKTVRIWDVETLAPLRVLAGHGDVVQSALFSPDGARIVSASVDKTARVWSALVPAGVAAQIAWSESAEFDGLSGIERARLGLRSDPRKRIWPGDGSACDQAAAAIHDPNRLTPGVVQAAINGDVANGACAEEIAKRGSSARLIYENGRALLAKHNLKDARQQFELAVSQGYQAALIDLANLLLDSSAGMLDPVRAVSLYEQAWRNDVTIAAFELGHLYEFGVPGSNGAASVAVQGNLSDALRWYTKGADAGEPNALARLAERDEARAVTDDSAQTRDPLLLEAFSFFAAAAERAQDEDWPDETWSGWRYHRATLSRLLARDGMMQQVADSYGAMLEKWKPRAPTWRQRIAAKLHL